jgi:transcription antitermination factor NusG
MSWFAVMARGNFEAKVHAAFLRDGVTDLYPFYCAKSRWSDRDVVIERPVFPGYLFASIAGGADRVRILGTTGVIRILGFLDPIPDGEIEQIKRMMASPESLAQSVQELYEPQQGHEVEVSYGPMVGLRGRVTRLKGKVRVWVSIPSMMAGVPIEVDAQSLRRV